MADGDAQWEELRKEARRVEGDLDVKLSSYGKLCSILSHRGYGDPGSPNEVLGGADGSWKSTELEIVSLLERLEGVNDAMSRCVAAATRTASANQKLARHREILHEFSQEFRRTKGNIASMREHAELLTSVRSDINDFKSLSGSSSSSSVQQQQLTERRAIHGNIAQMDDLISQASSTKAALANQRALFSDVQGRLKQLGERFPLVRSVLGAIRRKKSRDSIILAAVIAACTSFLIIYSWTK